MKVKTSKAKDQVLNHLVAKCEGLVNEDGLDVGFIRDGVFTPSIDWAQGGLIIEREKLGVWWATHYVDDDGVEYGNHWYAEPGCTDDNADKPYRVATGPTPLIAAMRCYVVNKLGDEVEVPNELA
jgi:hypothetical protein